MSANLLVTIAQTAAEDSKTYADKAFRNSDLGATQVECVGFSIAANSGVALAAALLGNLMKLSEGARVKMIVLQVTTLAAGQGAACSFLIGHKSSDTDRLASDDNHYLASLAFGSQVANAMVVCAPEQPPDAFDETVWYVNQEFKVPVDLQLKVAAGYKSSGAVTGNVIIYWEP